ncbi:MAG TPA: MarR family transcriptional regulator [Chthonomonadaceae bacterium]|nr:MarR family transcriptional regulator [Chthonomonadaceae bacterium]
MSNPHPTSIGHALPLSLRRAYLALHRETDAALAPIGLTADQFVLMAALMDADSATQQELARRTDSDANTLREMLLLLEKKGWVRRGPHPTDRRARTVALTEEGRRVYAVAWERSDPVRATLYAELGPEEADILVRLLGQIAAMLSRPSLRTLNAEQEER